MPLLTNIIQAGLPVQATTAPSAAPVGIASQIVSAQSEMMDAAAAGDTVTATASLVNGAASVPAAATGATQTATASLPISGTATGTAAAAGVTLTATASLVGPLTARQYVIGGLLPLFVEESNAGREFIVGATFVSETLAGAEVGAAASGATIAATTAIVAGSTSGAAIVSGQTLSTTAAIIAGTASGATTGAAAGAVVTASVSMLAGAATGVANQTGATVTATATLIAGTASAAASATASGATLTTAASLIGGGTAEVFRQYAVGGLLPIFIDETAARQAIVSATFVEETSTAAVVWATGGASAGAELLTAAVSVVSGSASGVASVSGATVTAAATLIAGMATAGAAGDAFAEGSLLEATASLVPGVATAESVIAIIGGGGQRMRFEPQDGLASGVLIVCRARLIAGHASTLSLLPGMAHGNAEAANDNLPPAFVSLVAGEAQGQRSYSDDELLMIFAEAA